MMKKVAKIGNQPDVKNLAAQCAIHSVVCSCYLCDAPIPEKKDQYEMYGEKVCKSCCDEQSDMMLRMSGHEY